MSTIYPQQGRSSPGVQPTLSNSTPGQPGLTSECINGLLKSGPNWSMPPKQPEPAPNTPAPRASSGPEARKAASELETLLTETNIEKALREPDSNQSKELLERSKKLANEIAMNTPHSAANAKTPWASVNQLSHDKITAQAKKVINEMRERHIQQIELDNFSQIAKAFDSDGVGDSVAYMNNAQNGLADLKQKFSRIEATAKKIEEMGTQLNATLRSSPANTPYNADAKTYRYGSLSESPLNAPSEIKNFNNNDKIDLTNIQKQLNTPLHLVEKFSGARGEMQIHYLPSTRTSVLIVANDPGTPPMVIKVFGELRYQNLVT